MIIEKNKVVTLDYTLRKNDESGDVIEDTFSGDALTFIFGIGMMIPAFEENIEGKKSGDEASFGIPAENAYGVRDEAAEIEVPLDYFADEEGKVDRDKLVPGHPISLQDSQGQVYQGVIVSPGIEKVKIDFNHPMADQDLHFTVKIKEVRDAAESELDHGHVHE